MGNNKKSMRHQCIFIQLIDAHAVHVAAVKRCFAAIPVYGKYGTSTGIVGVLKLWHGCAGFADRTSEHAGAAVASPKRVEDVKLPYFTNMLKPQPVQLLCALVFARLHRPQCHAPFDFWHLRHSLRALKFL